MGIKLAVVGAGSTYCPELMQGFIRRSDILALEELRLVDIDESRLHIVGDFCERLLRENGIKPRIVQTCDLSISSPRSERVVWRRVFETKKSRWVSV